jgi:hypothetical protein
MTALRPSVARNPGIPVLRWWFESATSSRDRQLQPGVNRGADRERSRRRLLGLGKPVGQRPSCDMADMSDQR